jgi:hypothetical protein
MMAAESEFHDNQKISDHIIFFFNISYALQSDLGNHENTESEFQIQFFGILI